MQPVRTLSAGYGRDGHRRRARRRPGGGGQDACRDGKEAVVGGDFFVTATGRGAGLRKEVGLDAEVLESSFDIYWMKFDPAGLPEDHALVPDGFHAYLQDDSMFIFYRTYDRRIQVAWGKRGWNAAGLRIWQA